MTSTLSAAQLYTVYTDFGGTKSFKSFKNKAAIQAALDALDTKPDATPAEQHDDHVRAHFEAAADEVFNGTAEQAAADAATPAPDATADVQLGLITEKLNKVQRAKLRKLMGGKLGEGRWNTTPIDVTVLAKVGVAFKPA